MMALFSRRARVIAEDLGVVPDFIRTSLDALEIPGYRVQRWERDWNEPGQPFRDPAQWPAVSVATTGTHDTDSLGDWYESLNAEDRRALLALPALASLRERAPARFDAGVRDAMLELLYASSSDLLLLPFQDLLGHRERVNVPGTVNAQNWTYRMPTTISALIADHGARLRLRGLAERSGRANAPPR
jgi:4-alpha-glucanotransferase